MTVKSDRWIRRMSEEAQLISPFSQQLIREHERAPHYLCRLLKLRLRYALG
ncbi:MAG: hypothetical protein WKF84_28885 [Pyrinomonadaceae bacterium]